MSNVLIWVLGSLLSNALMDVMIVIRFTTVRPTVFGVVYTTLHVQRLNVPKPYKALNSYFSILLTWGMGIIALFAIIAMVIFKNANNGKEGDAGGRI